MNLMGPLDRIMYQIVYINIHQMKVIHAAKDHIEKTESVYYVREVPIKKMRAIIHAPHELLDQQILNLVQITLSIESYAQQDTIIAIMGHLIVINAKPLCTESQEQLKKAKYLQRDLIFHTMSSRLITKMILKLLLPIYNI